MLNWSNLSPSLQAEFIYIVCIVLLMFASICWTIYGLINTYTNKDQISVQERGLEHDIFIGVINIIIALYLVPKFWYCSRNKCEFEKFEILFLRTIGVFLLITGIGHIIRSNKWLI